MYIHSCKSFNHRSIESPFLDTLVKRQNNRFLTSDFREKTVTGNYLNFQSNCSMKRKVNLIRTLCHRAHKICSPELFSKEVIQIKVLLNKNEYPQDLVKKNHYKQS